MKTYLRRHGDGMMLSISRGLRLTEAIAEYRRLLDRSDLIGQPWSAVLRDEVDQRTLLFSRFDFDDQRLLAFDLIDLEEVFMSDEGSDEVTRAIVANRSKRG